ncbi:hypothetical protein [Rhizobium sp. RU20A]|uniref:hypothetical protein n=1 Tax=Rhizobium sp. RU20A TaxID=1907412 RepID=UPI00122C6E7B|nr:hypothetical protein [Rhizobium sp. RU20A]
MVVSRQGYIRLEADSGKFRMSEAPFRRKHWLRALQPASLNAGHPPSLPFSYREAFIDASTCEENPPVRRDHPRERRGTQLSDCRLRKRKPKASPAFLTQSCQPEKNAKLCQKCKKRR